MVASSHTHHGRHDGAWFFVAPQAINVVCIRASVPRFLKPTRTLAAIYPGGDTCGNRQSWCGREEDGGAAELLKVLRPEAAVRTHTHVDFDAVDGYRFAGTTSLVSGRSLQSVCVFSCIACAYRFSGHVRMCSRLLGVLNFVRAVRRWEKEA